MDWLHMEIHGKGLLVVQYSIKLIIILLCLSCIHCYEGNYPIYDLVVPPNITLTSSDETITLEWEYLPMDVSYNIYWTDDGTDPIPGQSPSIQGATSPYDHTGLVNGIEYRYIITAQMINDSGEIIEGDYSIVLSGVPGNPVPEPPSGMYLVDENYTITIQWNGNPNTIGYNIYLEISGQPETTEEYLTTTLAHSLCEGFVCTTEIPVLINNEPYNLIITGYNDYGESIATPVESIVPQYPFDLTVFRLWETELPDNSSYYFAFNANAYLLAFIDNNATESDDIRFQLVKLMASYTYDPETGYGTLLVNDVIFNLTKNGTQGAGNTGAVSDLYFGQSQFDNEYFYYSSGNKLSLNQPGIILGSSDGEDFRLLLQGENLSAVLALDPTFKIDNWF